MAACSCRNVERSALTSSTRMPAPGSSRADSQLVDFDLPALHVIGATQRAHVDVVGGAEDSRRHVGEPAGRPARAVRRCRRRCRWTPRSSAAAVSVRWARSTARSCRGRTSGRRSARRCGPRATPSYPFHGEAAPIAVDTVPSMPATPRLDRTRMPWVFRPTSAASRTGLDAPSTSWSPGRSASATAAATCRPVVSGWAASCSRTAAKALPVHLRAAVQPGRVRCPGGDRPRAGGLRVTRDVRPARPGGQRVHRHLRVGQQRRHRAVQCRAAEHDHLLRAQQRQCQRVQRVGPRRRDGAVGSATVGNPARLGCTPAPCPAITTVSGVRSMSSGWSKVTGGV